MSEVLHGERSANVHATLAADIIRRSNYITIATASPDASPAISPVFAVCDPDLNFYWSSSPESEHSGNIRTNEGQIAFVLFDTTEQPKMGVARGVYFSAVANELATKGEVLNAMRILSQDPSRDTDSFDTAKFMHNSPLRLYRATPHGIWINGVERRGEREVEIRIPVSQKHLKASLKSHA